MQSKTSSSKSACGTLFRKNMKRSWPIWAGYSFMLFWMLTAAVFIILHFSFMDSRTVDELARNTIEFIYNDEKSFALVLSVIFSAVAAMTMFSYLGNEKSCYFYHSLPITRTQLLTTNMLSAIAELYIPNIIFVIITWLVCINGGCNAFIALKALLIWLLVISVAELFYLALFSLCMVIFGQNVFSAVMMGIVLCYVPSIVLLLNNLYRVMFFGGTSDMLSVPDGIFGFISPVGFFRKLSVVGSENDPFAFELVDYPLVLITAVAASVLMAVLLVVLYRARKSENSGELVAIGFLKPVFEWGFGISMGVLMMNLIGETLFSYMFYTKRFRLITFFLLILFSIVAYIVAKMLVKKTFRIFKGLGRQFVFYVVFLIVASGLILVVGKAENSRVPDAGKLQSVRVDFEGYSNDFTDKEKIAVITDIHRSVVENCDRLAELNIGNGIRSYMRIEYTYANGKTLRREYPLPEDTDEFNAFVDFCFDNATDFLFGFLDDWNITGGEVGVFSEYGSDERYDAETVRQLVLALKEDIDCGNIDSEVVDGWVWYKYTDHYRPSDFKEAEYILYVDIRPKEAGSDPRGDRCISYYFNDDCVNVMKVLEK